jgi:hypothetical protein
MIALPGTAGLALQRAQPAEGPSQWNEAFAEIRALKARIAVINFRLTTANDSLCDTHLPQAGFLVQDALQYPPEIRAAAVRFFHMEAGPAVMLVVPGGPADKAGLRADDTILAIDDRTVDTVASSKESARQALSYASIDALSAKLDRAFAKGETILSVRRGTDTLRIPIVPVPGCYSRADFFISKEMNSYADGVNAALSTAVVEYSRDDDELAIVLGHEMAHNVQHDRVLPGSAVTGVGRIEARIVDVRESETEADYVGVYLMARAGYDFHKASGFWSRYGKEYGLGIFAAPTHPGWTKRARLTEMAAAEIEAKQAHGLPLIPDLPFFEKSGQPAR